VTDAIAPAGLGPGRFRFARWDLVIGDDMVARAPDRSHFVGSGITMKQNAENLRRALGLSDTVVRKLTLENPRVAIGA
jgi:N-acetylglucosamine-6-phosphate deacetylase